MSTFDTMQDLAQGNVTRLTALTECIDNLALWSPEVKGTEAFEAICKIVSDMTHGDWELRN